MDHTPVTTRTPDELIRDLEDLVTEARALMANATSGESEDAIRALQARFDAARARLGELYAGARDRIAAGAKGTDEAIRAHPYQSLAIALGVGVLVGTLIGRRSR